MPLKTTFRDGKHKTNKRQAVNVKEYAKSSQNLYVITNQQSQEGEKGQSSMVERDVVTNAEQGTDLNKKKKLVSRPYNQNDPKHIKMLKS